MLSAQEAEDVLTDLGFPIDARETLANGDTRLEVELTSNRGDCLSHVGLAREIAARTGRALKVPECELPTGSGVGGGGAGEPVQKALTLAVEVPEACPRFTARVIRGVRIGPSPAWLVQRLESVGQRSINNVVDATNLVNFEFGQPTHVFDLAKIAGARLTVRWARGAERLTTLDGKGRVLAADQLVIADVERPQSLAGVMGGQDSEVTGATRDVALEAATWDPLVVRRAARAHQLRTDASHRYERRVDARTIDAPAARLARLILELAGGSLCDGVLDVAGTGAMGPIRSIRLRLSRAESLLGVGFDEREAMRLLQAIGVESRSVPGQAGSAGGVLECTAPAHRPDLVAEIDLIEELARVKGYAHVPTKERLAVAVRPVQASERAVAEIGRTLTGLGFFETVTYSFTTPKLARALLEPGTETIEVDDERRKHEPALRPSVLAGLLVCRKANEDARVQAPGSGGGGAGGSGGGGVRLFEIASSYAQRKAGPGQAPATLEQRTVAMVMDVPSAEMGKPASHEQTQLAVRHMRGVIEAVSETMGFRSELAFKALSSSPCMDPAAGAEVWVRGSRIGSMGLVSAATRRLVDLATPIVACELPLEPLIAAYPPRSSVRPLPTFPGIERDLSLIVAEATTWGEIESLVLRSTPARLEGASFVGVYRGPQAGAGKKSVTLRLRFRDPAKTLRHEEVDPEMKQIMDAATAGLGASVRV